MDIFLKFYQVEIKIQSESKIVLERLQNDFQYFHSRSDSFSGHTLNLNLSSPPSLPPKLIAKEQTPNFLIYHSEGERWVDYYGEALTHVSTQNDAQIYSLNLDRLHEIAYLYILSYVGKKHDLSGWHKLHCFAVEKKKHVLLGVMPMKGGKTSSFLKLLEDKEVNIISDDCPLIDRKGNIYPFPLRVGVDNPISLPEGDSTQLYSINRRLYGTKTLAPLSYFKNSISSSTGEKITLIIAKRSTYTNPHIEKISCLSALTGLIPHMVAGLGLPMVIEYFLNFNFKDIFFLSRLALSRTIAAIRLTRKAQCYRLILCSDITRNADELKKLLNNVSI